MHDAPSKNRLFYVQLYSDNFYYNHSESVLFIKVGQTTFIIVGQWTLKFLIENIKSIDPLLYSELTHQ